MCQTQNICVRIDICVCHIIHILMCQLAGPKGPKYLFEHISGEYLGEVFWALGPVGIRTLMGNMGPHVPLGMSSYGPWGP